MYICVCFIQNQYNTSSFCTGFVDPIQYSTWCQNRGCICISPTKRTYRSNPAVSCIHPFIQTRTIILQTELFPKKRREKISKERYFNLQIQCFLQDLQCFHTQFSHPMLGNYSTYRINSPTRILQEILQLQGSSHTDRYKASFSNCFPCIQAFYMAEQGSWAPTAHPGFQLILPTETAL